MPRTKQPKVQIAYNHARGCYILLVGFPGNWTRFPYSDQLLQECISNGLAVRFWDAYDRMFVLHRVQGKWYLNPGERVAVELGSLPQCYCGTVNTVSLEKILEAHAKIVAQLVA